MSAVPEQASLLVINLHGGLPAALVDRALSQLRSLRALRARSTAFTRSVATGVDPSASFLHAISELPLGCSHAAPAPQTLFHALRRHGYRTELRGVFGLDARLDARRTTDPAWDASGELASWGIDAYDARDAFFDSSRTAVESDADVFRRAAESLRGWRDAVPRALFVNCTGCADVDRLVAVAPQVAGELAAIRIGAEDPSSYAHRFEAAEVRAHAPFAASPRMDRHVSPSVLDDDALTAGSRAHAVPGVRAQARCRLRALGVRGSGALPADRRLDACLCAHALAWRYLVHLDAWLATLLDALEDAGASERTAIVFAATQGLALLEHGTVRALPWEASLRALVLVHRAGQVHTETLLHPLSLAHLGTLCLWACRISVRWRGHATWMLPPPRGVVLSVTLDAARVAATAAADGARAWRHAGFCVRAKVFHARWYAVAVWFSARTLVCGVERGSDADGLDDGESDDERDVHAGERREWDNPVLACDLARLARAPDIFVQVYDHMLDAEEMVDLATDASWLRSTTASALKAEYDAAVRASLGGRLVVDLRALEQAEQLQRCSERVAPSASVPVVRAPLAQLLGELYGEACATAALRALEGTSHAIVTAFVCSDVAYADAWPGAAPLPLAGAFDTSWRGEFASAVGTRVHAQPGRTLVNGRTVDDVLHVPHSSGTLVRVRLGPAAPQRATMPRAPPRTRPRERRFP